jgi:hypothetical protein
MTTLLLCAFSLTILGCVYAMPLLKGEGCLFIQDGIQRSVYDVDRRLYLGAQGYWIEQISRGNYDYDPVEGWPSPNGQERLLWGPKGLYLSRIGVSVAQPILVESTVERIQFDYMAVEWSSDGQWVAIKSYDKLTIVNTAGQTAFSLTDTRLNSAFHWTGDSTYLVYRLQTTDSSQSVWLWSSASRTTIATGIDAVSAMFSVAPSHLGHELAMITRGKTTPFNLVLDEVGGGVNRVIPLPDVPDDLTEVPHLGWAPDDQHIVLSFYKTDILYFSLYTREGSLLGLYPLVDSVAPISSEPPEFDWIEGGRQIYFVERQPSNAWQMLIFDLTTQQRVVLATGQAWDAYTILWDAHHVVMKVSSPVEKTIVFDLITGRQLLLPGDPTEFAWSPDGQRLAWIAQNHLHITDMDTGVTREVSDFTTSDHPAWSANGKHVVIRYDVPGPAYTTQLGIVGRDGKVEDRLTFPNTVLPTICWAACDTTQ